jgi:exodeoxyribonuclease V alpha subunit
VGVFTKRLLDVDGFRVVEHQVEADRAELLSPAGEHIVDFLAGNRAFAGIGLVKAKKLWEIFGDEIYALLDAGDVHPFQTVLSPSSAAQLLAGWAVHGDGRTLQWLQAAGFDVRLGRKVLEFFGSKTRESLEEDPYRLLSFCGSWLQVDSMARTNFGVGLSDPRRLKGAIEEACYRVFAAGHTNVLSSELMGYLQAILGTQTASFRWRNLCSAALSEGLSNGSFVVSHHGVQPLGALVMERQIAQAVAGRIGEWGDLPVATAQMVDAMMSEYEEAEQVFLHAQQRHAVHLVSQKRLTLVTGGAGVGKTTVLKVIYKIFQRAGLEIVQLALAGRAAKRMQEATGLPARTIASFLGSGLTGLDDRVLVVVDEASMVDVITMSRLCEMLGERPRMLLVGDPAQLMPVGPGLVLHVLSTICNVPNAELTTVKRFSGEIAAAALSIRQGHWPLLGADAQAAIAFLPVAAGATDQAIAATVVRLYGQDPENTQVLCARRSGPDGTKFLNQTCQASRSASARELSVWSRVHEAWVYTGLRLGDPVLCTKNLWDIGLQNGSLGVITQIGDEPPRLHDDSLKTGNLALAWVDWDDGERRPIVEAMLDKLELGYAITVHKAQGSQWPRVIVPLTGHRLLDRTLVYTAITRAQKQVLMVGDEAAASAAVTSLPRAHSRKVALDLHVAAAVRALTPQSQ